jgi:hypothetical protein
MMRVAFQIGFTAAAVALAACPAPAQLPVAPPPREIRPDGSRDPAPAPEAPAKAEDPAAVVDRIIKNSKDVGDKLEQKDTGTDTRKTQDKILSDIDSLINRQENPPPPKDNKDDKQKDNKDKNNDPMMNKDPMNMNMPPKMGDMPMDKKGMNDGMPMNMGGMDDPQPMGGNARRPRMGEDNKKEPDKTQAKQNLQKPDDKKTAGQPKDNKDPKNPSGATAGNPGGKVQGKPTLPFDEDVAKDVWGHLPPKLRQQMAQYYQEDVMPKYAELLRLYYSSLAEKSPPMPKK